MLLWHFYPPHTDLLSELSHNLPGLRVLRRYPGPDTAIQRLDPPLLWHRPYPCGTALPPNSASSAAMVVLKGIPKVLSPELLFALARMGHGDEIGELVESQARSVASSSGAVCTGSP